MDKMNSSERKYRIVSGVSYPRLYTGPNQPREIKAGIDQDTRGYYHDDSIKLNAEDVRGFVGKPICLEHDESVQVGKITAAWQDRDNHMRITARIWTDTPMGEEVFQRINNGDLRGFSVGYDVSCARDNPNQVVGKHFNEISVCQEPFFEGASITVAATKKQDYKSGMGPGILNFKIMAEQKINEEVPLEEANKDSSEIARAHDEVLRKTEQMEAELAALKEAQKQKDEELARFHREREAQRAQYAEDNKPVLEEVLEINKAQYKEEHGENAELPEDYVASTTAAFMAPEAAKVIAPIVASARAWKKNREAAKAQDARLAEMEEKLKKMSEDQNIAEAHVRASSRRLAMATGQHEVADTTDDRRLAVTASGKLDVKNLFVPQQPNEQERALAQLNYGQTLPVSVTASAGQVNEMAQSIPELPKNLAASVPNSMRYSDNGKYIFHHLVANNRRFGSVAPMDMKKETEMLNH